MANYLLRKDTGELQIVSGSEPFTVTPGSGNGTYEVYRIDNSASVTVTSDDAIAPNITDLTATISPQNQATLEWSTDEANGTAYWVCTTSVTVPSPAQIKTGQNHLGSVAEASGAQSVTTTGEQSTEPVDGLQNGGSYSFHLMQEDESGNTSETLTTTVVVPDVDTSLPALHLTSSALETTATLSYSTTKPDGGIYWVLTASATQPPVWRIRRAQDHTGADAISDGYQRVTNAGAQPDVVVMGLDAGETYYFHMYHRDASANTSAVTSTSISIEDTVPFDTTAPSLTNITASAVGTTATLRWSSNEGNGTGFWVCTTSSIQPTAEQIISGEDHTGSSSVSSGTQAVSNTGVQTDQVVPGLSEGGTYFFHLLQRDVNGNVSARYFTPGVTVASSSGASAEINVVRRSVTEAAPEGLVFDIALDGFDTQGSASGEVYNPQLHDLNYYWDFGDSYQFQSPENLIPEFRNSGIAYGPKVSHVYRQPGTYNVSCLVVEMSSGKSTTANLSITIGNPDALYSGANTYYVDETYDGSTRPADAPAGAQIWDSLQNAWDSVWGSDQATPKRLMLARGQTYTPNELRPMGITNAAPSVFICASPGNGSDPIIDTTTFDLTFANTDPAAVDMDLRMQDIEWVGPYDVITQSGPRNLWMYIYENRPLHFLIDRCTYRGYDLTLYPVFSQSLSPDPYIFVNDSVFTDYRSGTLFGDANWVVTGNRIAQNPDALCGYAGAENNLISCVRFPASPNVIFQQNDMFSRTGWFSNIPGIYTLQGCFRGNTAAYRGAFYNVWGNTMEGGVATFSIDINDSDTSYAINAVIDKNIVVGYHDSYRSMEFGFGGITIRNNVCILPNAPRYGIALREFITFYRRGSDVENANTPIKIYNNTFVNLADTMNAPDAQIPVHVNSEGYTDYYQGNNVSHQPEQGLAVDNLDTSVLWLPRYTHYEDDNTARDETKATPDSTISLYRPLPGSSVLGDALNGTVSHDDFFGNVRPQYPSRGALEAS